jgi:hypothetical protein
MQTAHNRTIDRLSQPLRWTVSNSLLSATAPVGMSIGPGGTSSEATRPKMSTTTVIDPPSGPMDGTTPGKSAKGPSRSRTKSLGS